MIFSILILIIFAVVVITMASTSAGVAGMTIAYNRQGKFCHTEALYGGSIQSRRDAGVTPTAGIWTEQFYISSKLNHLKPGKMYAVDRIEAHGVSTGTALVEGYVRLRHSSFGGLRPGGKLVAEVKGTQSSAYQVLRFDQHGRNGCHPVFDSTTPLYVDWLSSVAVAPLYFVVHMVEVNAYSIGQEDLNCAYKSNLDDAQTFATLTVVAGDSLEIRSDCGDAFLKVFDFVGLHTVFGRISSPQDNMMPNAIIYANTGAQCRVPPIRELRMSSTTTVTLELASYVAPT
jgi:hypothetical protein